jgi:hypothetical protein
LALLCVKRTGCDSGAGVLCTVLARRGLSRPTVAGGSTLAAFPREFGRRLGIASGDGVGVLVVVPRRGRAVAGTIAAAVET